MSGIFYQGFFFLSFSLFFALSPSSLNGTKLYPDMVGSKCNLKMDVRNLGYPLPLQIGGPKTTFWRFRNLRATLTAYMYIGMKYDIHKRVSVLQTTSGLLYIISKRHELWSTECFKLDRSFYQPCVNFAFHFIAKLRWRRSAKSANGTQPHFVKRCR